MASAPEEFSNIQINDETDEIENRANKLVETSTSEKKETVSISICSEKTCDVSTNDGRQSRKKNTKLIPYSLSSNIYFHNKKELYIEDEFFLSREESAFEILNLPTKENEKEETKKIEIEKTPNEKNKNSIIENQTIKISPNVENNNEIINKKKIIKDENITNKNIIKNKNQNLNKNNYSQIIDMKLFKEKPPKISRFYFKDYGYENKNVFSHLNDSIGSVNETKKIENIFYNHLLINNEKNNIRTSTNIRNDEKLLTVIYYSN